MNFIKKVFDNRIDHFSHIQFQKFSKGEFRDRAIIEAKNSGGKYNIKTSSEFANEIVLIVAQKLGSTKTNVTGAVVSTSDLKDKLEFTEIKQFQGVKKYMINKEMSGDEIIELLNQFPKTFFDLSFNAPKDDTQLKIKPKAPKSGKPGSKGEDAPKADFCILKTNDKDIAHNFIFEKQDFKTAKINHTFFIDSMVIPEELKNSKDFAKIREECKRKGRIIRKAVIDGQEITKEFEFMT